MARTNPSWGGERIAAAFAVRLGLRVSPLTAGEEHLWCTLRAWQLHDNRGRPRSGSARDSPGPVLSHEWSRPLGVNGKTPWPEGQGV